MQLSYHDDVGNVTNLPKDEKYYFKTLHMTFFRQLVAKPNKLTFVFATDVNQMPTRTKESEPNLLPILYTIMSKFVRK
jgi:hypothetical protein